MNSSAPCKYPLRNRKESSPDTVTSFAGTVEDTSAQVALQLEEAVHEAELHFEVPEDIPFNAQDMALFAHCKAQIRDDIPIYYYFPNGTRANERNFVFNSFILFCDWRRAQDYNAPINVIDQRLVRITSSAGRFNKTADDSFKQEFGSMPSFCSALVYISRNRNRWPATQRNQPKVYIRFGNSEGYFPFTG